MTTESTVTIGGRTFTFGRWYAMADNLRGRKVRPRRLTKWHASGLWLVVHDDKNYQRTYAPEVWAEVAREEVPAP